MSVKNSSADQPHMSHASILRTIDSALEPFDLSEQGERSARSEIEECIDAKLTTACEPLHCESRLDSIVQRRLIGAESLSALDLTLHIAPSTAANGTTYTAPVVRDVRARLSEAAASVARHCGEGTDLLSITSVDWRRDRFVANIEWVLSRDVVERLSAEHDRKAEETVARLKMDATDNASRYELESELVRIEMAANNERLNTAIAERTRSHNAGSSGRRGLRSYKKPARRFAKRTQLRGTSKSAKPIERVRVPRLGGAANLKPFVESGARMRQARAARRAAEGGVRARLAAAVRNVAASMGFVAAPLDERESQRESERIADYVAAHAADDDLFVY